MKAPAGLLLVSFPAACSSWNTGEDIRSLACEELENGAHDPSCSEQLPRNVNLAR